MRTRAALQTAPEQRLIVDEIEVPDPLPDQVVVKLASSGVCHSQLHGMNDPNAQRPMVLGHEGAGVVTAVGRDVTHLSEGDHAIVTWVPRTPQIGRKDATPVGATYREELKTLISQSGPSGSEFMSDPRVREIASELPRLQSQLEELRREAEH